MGIRVLAVIPARGGSKGIRRKNLRLMRGVPLLTYILNVATSCPLINDVIVSTDDPDISEFATMMWDVNVRVRPPHLCGDDVTLDPVVDDAVVYAEEVNKCKYDVVVTLQPTSPTLRVKTLQEALSLFIEGAQDTCIAVVDDTHLRWQMKDNRPVPLYKERLNRQRLAKEYKETGAFLISRRSVVNPSSRFGEAVELYPVSREEGIDVNDTLDWLIAEALLGKLRIALVVAGNRKLGMGHIYRALTLADVFLGNDIRFLGYGCDPRAIQLVKDQGYDITVVSDESAMLHQLREYAPSIVINDILDTERKYVEQLRTYGGLKPFVVNFEDLGEGSMDADLVFNALYEFSAPPPHHRFGAKYVCLGSSFLLSPPAPFRERVTTLLITFGGVDENNLTLRVCKTICGILSEGRLERALVILGPGYGHREELDSFLRSLDTETRRRFLVKETVENMARLMREADVAITSNGRTIYELTAMGVPGVCIAQNDRETLHLFSRYSKGFKYLGIASSLKEQELLSAIEEIVTDNEVRKRMRGALLCVDLRSGVKRVRQEILEHYWRWKDEDSDNREAYDKQRAI